MANFYVSQSVVGLGTVATVTAPSTSIYSVEGKISVPTIGQGATANSSVVAVVNVNGSPVYTGSAGAEGLQVKAACNAGDIITVVLSSSNPVDLGLNKIKSTISVSESV